MPIYEFYCSACNTLFNFFSAAVDTDSRPACPRCETVRLERRPASFATLKRLGGEEEESTPFDDLDEERMGGVMESLMGEMEGLDEGDPRQIAHMMRRFGESSGLELGPRMREMIGRLEAGEDPDAIEDDLEGPLEGDDSLEEFFRLRRSGVWRERRRPAIDDTLYFL